MCIHVCVDLDLMILFYYFGVLNIVVMYLCCICAHGGPEEVSDPLELKL